MSKLITTEEGFEIRLGKKNPTCYPCCFEGSVCACRSDLLHKASRQLSSEMVKRVAQPTCVPYLRGKTQEVMVRFIPVEMIVRL